MHSFENLEKFKEELLHTIEPNNIITERKSLYEYSEDEDKKDGTPPYMVIFPEKKEQVQAAVRLANYHKMPLVPVSSGPPRFHGDTVPETSGVVIDFSRMNKVWEINSISRFTRIGPGVTYAQIVPELKRQGLRLNMPLLPRANKSVLTSCLEREPRIIPKYQYDYMDPLLTLEVICGTGDELRTGSASGPGTLATLKADKVNPWGPGSVDYLRIFSGAQGTMGLATWATTKAEIIPEMQRYFYIPIVDPDRMIQAINVLLRKRVVDECLLLNHANLATILAENWPEDFQYLKKHLPPWTLVAAVAGYHRRPEQRICIQEQYLKEICTTLNLKPSTTLPGVEHVIDRLPNLLGNPWYKEPYWKLRQKGASRNLFFLSPMSRVSYFIKRMNSISCQFGYDPEDMGGYIQPMVQGRGCHCEFNLPYDPNDLRQRDRVGNVLNAASMILISDGAFFSRPYGLWGGMAFSHAGQEVQQVLKKIKLIFDPQKILNPGKLCF